MQDYKSGFEIVSKLYEASLKQNERYFQALRFYGSNWDRDRDIARRDRGQVAREVLNLKKESI